MIAEITGNAAHVVCNGCGTMTVVPPNKWVYDAEDPSVFTFACSHCNTSESFCYHDDPGDAPSALYLRIQDLGPKIGRTRKGAKAHADRTRPSLNPHREHP